MRKKLVFIFAEQLIKNAWDNIAARLLGLVLLLLIIYAGFSGYNIFNKETASRLHFQREVREHWEDMPDKHPHRMAHYGYIVFRDKQPLSVFDLGLESFTGNAIFLEAHRQNSANFSAAGFNSGLLRFGEISMAMVLQILLPLVLFFIGFGSVAGDRENGTLKLLLTQGASWLEILVGKSLGLVLISWLFLCASLLLVFAFMLALPGDRLPDSGWLQLGMLGIFYAWYLSIISVIAVLVSAISNKSRTALVALTGTWLLLAVILPRATQAAGNYFFPSPSRIAFETAVEADLIKQGDSHDPNDAHYRKLKDSVLLANKVSSVEQLSFNYGGLQMKEGERISAQIYNDHMVRLQARFRDQNQVSRLAAFFNPFAAVRNLSAGLSGTDFFTYQRFQQQAEDYRYKLAQRMNDLQIQLISNQKLADTAHPYSISKNYWKAFPDFKYLPVATGKLILNESLSIASLLLWTCLLIFCIQILPRKLKAI